MQDTLISWAHHTLNWWWGCEKVSEACRHCYAETMAKLFGRGRCVWGKGGLRWIRENATRDARKLHAVSKASGEMQRIFVNSMSDTFEDHSGLHEARAHALGVMEAMPHAYWLLLTKRPENVLRMVPTHWLTAWPAHVWIGTTVENQQCADHRIPELLRVPARVRFLSCEPLLEPIYLRLRNHLTEQSPQWTSERHVESQRRMQGISWIICGGESGPHARPMHPDWARGLRDQCQAAGIPFHFKQWGEFSNRIWEYTPGREPYLQFQKVGKKVAGRLLDGVTHDEVPA